jgi:hypothetical protein
LQAYKKVSTVFYNNRYFDAQFQYAAEVKSATPGAELFGSWFVLFGNQNQAVNLWRYEKGYNDLDRFI